MSSFMKSGHFIQNIVLYIIMIIIIIIIIIIKSFIQKFKAHTHRHNGDLISLFFLLMKGRDFGILRLVVGIV
jgi:hypothetical protein